MSDEGSGKGIAGGLLLVEDNDADILFFKRALARTRPDVPLQVVTNGVAAVGALAEGRPLPSLVLLDLKLPRMSGLEILEWMKTQPHLRTVRTMVLTSSSEDSDIRRATALGVVCYVVKPVDVAQLREAVSAIAAYWAEPGEAAQALLARHAAAVSADT
jgi:CheY-like chemotaxis protein